MRYAVSSVGNDALNGLCMLVHGWGHRRSECIDTYCLRDGRIGLKLLSSQSTMWLHLNFDPRDCGWSISPYALKELSKGGEGTVWPLSMMHYDKLASQMQQLPGSLCKELEAAAGTSWIRLRFSHIDLSFCMKPSSGRTQLNIGEDVIYAQLPVLSAPIEYESVEATSYLPEEMKCGSLVSKSDLEVWTRCFKLGKLHRSHIAPELSSQERNLLAVDAIAHLQSKPMRSKQQKIERALEQLEVGGGSQEIFHRAELLASHRHLLEEESCDVTLHDWKSDEDVTLHLEKGDKNRYIDKLFKRARAIEERKLELLAQLDDIKGKIAAYETAIAKHKYEGTLPRFQLQLPQKKTLGEPRKAYHRFITDNGREIFVGKTSHDNMEVSFKIARGHDTWLHIHDYPGSHVVLSGYEPSDEASLRDAMLLAKHFSRGKDHPRALITITQAKYLRKIPGAKAGKVALAKFSTRECPSDPKRLSALLMQSKRGPAL